MTDTVDLTVADEVATVTLDRPDVRNAISAELAADLESTFDDVAVGEARCVLLRGAGSAFCAGGDIEAMLEAQHVDLGADERIQVVVDSVNRAVRAIHGCRLPTVAAIDGAAFGAGLGLALACDLQVASTDATISTGFRRVGLATDTGVSALLPEYVGPNTAKELVFTGETLDADRARSLGLVTRLFDEGEFEAGLSNLVETIAAGPTVALSLSKQLMDTDHGSLSAALEQEAMAQALALETDDHTEGATAFLERREPSFEGS